VKISHKARVGVAVAAMLALGLSACSSGSDESSSAGEDNSVEETTEAEEEEAAGSSEDVAVDCQPVSAKASHHISSSSAVHRGLEVLAEEVSNGTDGRVTIEIASDGQLGGLAEMPENLRSGAVDIALVDAGSMSVFDPELGVTDLPFLWETMDEFNDVMDSPVGDQMNAKVQAIGIEPLYWSAVGLRDMFFVDTPATSPEQLSGLKMRVPEAPVWVQTFETLNASPTPIPGGEIYTAAQSGVIDGFELPLGTTVDLNLNEVVDYQTKTGHILTHIMIGASPSFLEKLCAEDLAALEAAVIAAQDDTRQGWKDDNAAAAEVLAAELTVNDADLQAFRDATAPVHEDFVAANGSELYDAVRAELGR